MSVIVMALIAVQLALTLVALVVLLRTPVERLRHAGRPVWLIVILVLGFLGSLAFLAIGRRRGDDPAQVSPDTTDTAALLGGLYGRRTP